MGVPGSGAFVIDRHPRPVRIVVLGPLAVTVDGVRTALAGRLQSRLIVVLVAAATNGSGVSVADLVDEVYGEDLPPKPRRALATLVWRMRRILGTDVITGDGTTYRLAPEACAIDAVEFAELLQHARALARSGDEAATVQALREALALWDADPAIESDPEQPVAIRLRELRVGATEHLAQAQSSCGDHGAAIELLEEVVAAHPEREHSHAQLIDDHLATGDLVGARRVHDRARRYLADQGIEPGAALQESAGRLKLRGRIPATGQNSPAPPAPDPTATISAERHDALRQVVTAGTQALTGNRAGAVLISGEPGIGKSTLASGAIRRLVTTAGSPRVVTLHGDPRRTLPYAPLGGLVELAAEFPGQHEPLTDLLLGQPSGPRPGASTVAAPFAGRDRINAAVLELARAACRDSGLILLIEDLQWAPPESVEVLSALLTRGTALPLAVIATTRDRQTPGEFARVAGTHLHLEGLSAAAITELIDQRPASDTPDRGARSRNGRDKADQLWRLTGGNPLYLQQLERVGALEPGALPAGLDAAITAHLSAIPSEIVGSLGLAAVVGQRFDIAVLAALTGALRTSRPDLTDRLLAAEGHGLIRRDRETLGQYTFVHGLIRDRLYQRLPAQRRTLAHAEVGRALDRLALGRPVPADLLAHHYVCGWPEVSTGEVIDKLGAAAEAAIAQLDFRQAADHHRRALDHLAMDPDAADPAEIAETLGKAARSAAAAGEASAATTLYGSQASLATQSDIPSARISAALGLLRTHHGHGARIPAADQLADALADAGRRQLLQGFPDLAGEALGAVQVQQPDRAQQLLDELSAAEPSMAAVLRRAVWEHRSVPDQVTIARQLVADPAAEPVGAWLRLWAGEVAAGLRAFDDPPDSGGQVRSADDRTQFEVTLWRITTTIASGRLHRAGALIDRALAAPRHRDAAETARRVANLHGQRLFLTLWTGDVGTVDQTAPLTVNPHWVTRHPIMRYLGAYLAALRGDRVAARDACDDLLDELADEAFPDSALLVRLGLLADGCRLAGYRRGMERCRQLLLPHSGHHAFFHFAQHWGATDRAIGRLHVELGDLDAGIVSLSRGLDLHRRARAVLHLRQSHLDLADVLDRRGRPEDRVEAMRHRERASRITLDVGPAASAPGKDSVDRDPDVAGQDLAG